VNQGSGVFTRHLKSNGPSFLPSATITPCSFDYLLQHLAITGTIDTGCVVGTASNSYKPALLVVWIVVAGDHCTLDNINWVGIILGTDSISHK